ncbi:MAG: hypothetical protein NVS2B4_16790 [Ramlibacter sp.]
MIFNFIRRRNALLRALRATVAAHRPAILRELAASHGEAAFAVALSRCSARVIADALSMLEAAQRAKVCTRLSRKARARYECVAGFHAAANHAYSDLPRRPLHGLLVWGLHS